MHWKTQHNTFNQRVWVCVATQVQIDNTSSCTCHCLCIRSGSASSACTCCVSCLTWLCKYNRRQSENSVWTTRDVFGRHEMCLEDTSSVWRTRVVFGGHEMCLEDTRCVWRTPTMYGGHRRRNTDVLVLYHDVCHVHVLVWVYLLCIMCACVLLLCSPVLS